MTFNVFKKNKPSILEMQLEEAVKELKMAQCNMDNAASEYVGVAIHLYNAAMERYNTLMKEAKEAGICSSRFPLQLQGQCQ